VRTFRYENALSYASYKLAYCNSFKDLLIGGVFTLIHTSVVWRVFFVCISVVQAYSI